jgi:hypothetical protein
MSERSPELANRRRQGAADRAESKLATSGAGHKDISQVA